jgi:two-component system, chemotaxis family, sensor kinase Cph1
MASLDFISQVKESIVHFTDPELSASDLSLNNCDREPIHIPSAIQSHGVLLAFSEADFIVTQVSRNSEVLLGLSPSEILGQPLSILVPAEQIQAIRNCLDGEFENVNPLRLQLQANGKSQPFEGVVHRTDGAIVLELERCVQQEAVNFFDFYKFVKAPINRIQNTQTLAELSTQAVKEIRSLTGFDRVMLYRFDEDSSGNVIAESVSEGTESFLGLRYPASDIPKQARELYRLNRLRIIPDISYEPVPLEPELNPDTGKPLDMSLSALRSVSPIHIEYLANMGVFASMSISLLRDLNLWGMIVCHHNSPRMLSYETRTICEFLGQVVSFELGAKADTEDLDYQMKLQKVHTQFVSTIAAYKTPIDGFNQNPKELIELVSASGAVFYEGAVITSFGKAPPEEVIPDLVKWVDRQMGEEAIYATSTLLGDYPDLLPYKDVASGLLALRISRSQNIYLLWFRPEVIQTIQWGGEPNKPIEADEEGGLRMSPRKSFELWKETVYQKSLPWKVCELNAALELRSSIIGIVLQKADELALLNSELERSNVELDSFAYVASHDLKEPLRGIYNYSTFLIEDYGDRLGEDGTQKLSTLMRLTHRMEDLINSLLHYSRLGRAELALQPVDLGKIVEGVLDVIKISQLEPVEFRIPRPLPTVQCDRIQIAEVFTNLISNAIKYNDKDQKWVEIGYLLPEEINQSMPGILGLKPKQTVIYVKDNGIGIRDKHLENIFKIFKRLHPANRYGGGTGAGLTIAKKIVERHGGSIAVESTFSKGSTFYFTLGPQQP